jgi:hypothetical protein
VSNAAYGIAVAATASAGVLRIMRETPSCPSTIARSNTAAPVAILPLTRLSPNRQIELPLVAD